ncbi:hypothetical protein BOC40_06525 [Burkholderia pseudomallei]|uniref:restriction endonuclease subunit S n=1 Tax=Burkholderia pseudomallei TaxID=28450 RepID=UPI000A1A2124|nr:restriction endonuclease subunit S [Burkholderia pseudomallei]ARK80117.1 hypothetical protein BOC40_06525 [Burkholderia pseudomallei]ARL46297.1 hypothetical protein BOC50_25380 [Burkholderia pseudomallei]
MSLPTYSEYKDSGISWLGKVPRHWEICALKRVASLRSGDGITAEQINEDGKYPVYGGNGLRGYTSSFTHEGRFALIGRQGALCGNINYSEGKFWASEHAVVTTPVKPANVTWLGELLRTMNLNRYSVSAAQPGLSVEIISNLGVPYPPLDEQSAIAVFLDCETGKIDALIDQQEKLLTLLAEKRQATISHVVTRGLNPEAPMRGSGATWLGEVPAHWKVLPFRRAISKIEQGWSPNAGNEPRRTDEWGVLKISAVKLGRFIEDENKALLDDTLPDVSIQVSPGDLLLTRANTPDLVGDCCVVPDGIGPKLMMSDLIYRVKTNAVCVPQFLCYFLISDIGRAQIRADARGSSMTMAKISQGHISGWTVCVPPLAEQAAIVTFLDAELSRLDALKAEVKRAIDLLKERRTALTSAAVTGKIDVRHAVPQELAA